MLTFLKTRWQLLLIGVALVALTAIVTTCQNRGTKIVSLESTIAKLDTLLGFKNDTIRQQRGQVAHLQRDTARLNKFNLQKALKIAELQGQLSAGERAALLTDQAIESGKRQVNYLTDRLSAYQLKEAADNGLRDNNLSFQPGQGTSVSDTAINARIAKLTGYGKVYHDSTQALKKTVGAQRETIAQQKQTISEQGDQISDLESTLNGVYQKIDSDFTESKKERHPLGFGQKKAKERLRQKVLSRVTP